MSEVLKIICILFCIMFIMIALYISYINDKKDEKNSKKVTENKHEADFEIEKNQYQAFNMKQDEFNLNCYNKNIDEDLKFDFELDEIIEDEYKSKAKLTLEEDFLNQMNRKLANR